MINLQQLISDYGYLALFVGTFLEGETIMLLSGFAAFTGHMELYKVVLVGGAGTFFGDQLYFYIGRWKGLAVFTRWPSWRARADRVACLLHRYQYPVILSFRFFYGLRNVTPFVIGMSPVKAWLYFVLNLLSATVWSVTFAWAGYLFGSAAERYLHNVKRFEVAGFAILAGIGLAVWIIGKMRGRMRRHQTIEICRPDGDQAPADPSADDSGK